ncbi:MAG TPA: PBP1A family penicillin-binding protein [Sandaracinaceae bacterium LLY-WYZ-13_1]|nr:PBP1A family penicillin-binding protein [Sandaracinaceae bacterium LLY-WYZ-13_1]
MWRWTKRLFYTLLTLVMLGGLGLGGAFWHYGRDLPEVDHLHDYAPPQVTRVVDRDGELLGESWRERRTVVPLERVPRVLVLSVLAAEDADFYRHQGLDYPGLIRAVARGIVSGGDFRGTSTITQQVIKNLLLSPERTISRKIRELMLARRLEQELSKDEILELYLNHVNFGHGRYGVQEASQYYFGKDVQDLTLAEASLIAGIPQSPTHLSPRTHPEAARRRQLFVLRQLEAKRAEYWPDLSAEAIAEARRTEVELVPVPDRDHPAPEVMALARRTLRERVGREAARRGGYTIHTTIDTELQRAARAALREGLEAIDERQRRRVPLEAPRRRRELEPVDTLRVGRTYDAVVTGTDDEAGLVRLDVGGHPAVANVDGLARYNPEGLPPSELAEEGARVRASIQQLPREADPEAAARARLELGPEGAVVLVDPRSRDVLALVGGYEEGPGFDRATRAVRQPGSTFKPFVYGQALRSRAYTPATIVIDAPGVYDDWRPSNYETWSFEGEIRLREALARSINQVAVRVIEDVEPPTVVDFARELGITTELDPTLALALGASDVRPIEMVNAYATFAAGGRWAPTRILTRIVGPDGREVPLPEREAPRDVMTPAEAYVLTSMLESVVDHGTARRARRLRRPAAGKTGTSNEARDAWFVGYTPDLVAGVWVGFDDRRPLGRRESGGRTALPIWLDLMRTAHEGRPRTEFPMPTGVVTARIDPATGLLAYEGQEDAIDEVFLEGTVPTETATPPDVLDPNSFLMQQFGGEEPEDAEAP